MSAAMKPGITRLEFPITKELPRKLLIEWDNSVALGVHIHAHVFVRGGSAMRSVAFGAAHEADGVSLSYTSGKPVLWLRSSQFELTRTEAAEVERMWGPLGLRIERGGSEQ